MSDIGVLRDDLKAKWLRTREMVIAQVEGLGEQQLAWRAGEGARSGLHIARHIAESSVALLDYAARGKKAAFEGPERDPGSREDVLAALREGQAGIEEDLDALSEEQLVEKITGLFGEEAPRLGFLTFAYAHEMYHYGQLGLCARGGGAVPALTQALRAQGVISES